MKRTLSILLAVMMLLSVAACNNAPASKKLTRGTWTGDEYANEFAGVRFTMPEGFVKLSDEELSEALSLGQEFIDATEDELKLAMAERGAEEMTAGAHRLSWKVVTSIRIDTAALKRTLPEIAARFTKESRACRFTIN